LGKESSVLRKYRLSRLRKQQKYLSHDILNNIIEYGVPGTYDEELLMGFY
jgi:hypothetical protein